MSRRNEDLTRYGIYKNKKRQQIYYDKRTKQAYLIQDTDVRKIRAFSNRIFLAAALGILAFGLLELNIYLSILLMVVGMAGMEYYFRKVLIGSFVATKNLEGVEFKSLKDARKEMDKGVLLVRIIGYFAGGVAIIIITFFSDYPIWQRVAIWAFSLYAIYNGIMNTQAYLEKGKE